MGFPGGDSGKEPSCQCRRHRTRVPSLGQEGHGGGHGNPAQYSCLENPMDTGAWWATVHGVAESQTRLKQISKHAFTGHMLTGLPSIIIGATKERSRAGFWRRMDSPPLLQRGDHRGGLCEEVTFKLKCAGQRSQSWQDQRESISSRGTISQRDRQTPGWLGY